MTLGFVQLEQLSSRGWTSVPGVVDATGVAQMQELVWEFLESRRAHRDDPANWPDKIDKLQPLRNQQAFDPFLDTPIDEICDQLIGPGKWTDLGGHPHALMSLPTAGPWILPHKIWHFDLPPRGPTETFGAVRFLGSVDDVEVNGGGTVVVEGSQRLVKRMVEGAPGHDAGGSADARKRLAKIPFFAELNDRGDDPADWLIERGDTIDGLDVRVVELTGKAGDLVVMHPWLMHNIAMNCSTRPRMMMSYTRYAADHSWF